MTFGSLNCNPQGFPILPPEFYNRQPEEVGKDLLGKLLVSKQDNQITVGKIVETEAYLRPPQDPASHAFRGKTQRNVAMFGAPGLAYVYKIHRVHCISVVTEDEDVASAVLIRAIEPVFGIEFMRNRRGKSKSIELGNGPGKLCQSLGIDRTFDGRDLTAGEGLWLAGTANQRPVQMGVTPRIGVTSAQELELRYYIKTSRYVSSGKFFRAP